MFICAIHMWFLASARQVRGDDKRLAPIKYEDAVPKHDLTRFDVSLYIELATVTKVVRANWPSGKLKLLSKRVVGHRPLRPAKTDNAAASVIPHHTYSSCCACAFVCAGPPLKIFCAQVMHHGFHRVFPIESFWCAKGRLQETTCYVCAVPPKTDIAATYKANPSVVYGGICTYVCLDLGAFTLYCRGDATLLTFTWNYSSG